MTASKACTRWLYTTFVHSLIWARFALQCSFSVCVIM